MATLETDLLLNASPSALDMYTFGKPSILQEVVEFMDNNADDSNTKARLQGDFGLGPCAGLRRYVLSETIGLGASAEVRVCWRADSPDVVDDPSTTKNRSDTNISGNEDQHVTQTCARCVLMWWRTMLKHAVILPYRSHDVSLETDEKMSDNPARKPRVKDGKTGKIKLACKILNKRKLNLQTSRLHYWWCWLK
jgi:hypothetical protein